MSGEHREDGTRILSFPEDFRNAVLEAFGMQPSVLDMPEDDIFRCDDLNNLQKSVIDRLGKGDPLLQGSIDARVRETAVSLETVFEMVQAGRTSALQSRLAEHLELKELGRRCEQIDRNHWGVQY